MPKIIPNNSFKAALLKTMVYDISNRNEHISFIFMDGTLPTKPDLLSCIESYHEHGWPVLNSTFRTNVEALGGGTNVLMQGTYSNFTYQEHLEPQKVRMFLSKRTERFTPDLAGTAGWFVMGFGPAGAMFTTANYYWLVAGSIGAIGSGADLELTNPVLDPSVPVKLNDITFNYNIIGGGA